MMSLSSILEDLTAASVIPVMVAVQQVFHGLVCHPADSPQQALCVLCIPGLDGDHTLVGDDEIEK